MENDDRQGVVHPEQTQEDMVPGRHLAGASSTGAIAGEAETEVRFVWNQTGITGVKNTLEQDQHRHVNREGMNVMNHEVRCAQRDRSSGDLATYSHNRTVEHFTDAGKGVGCGAAGSCSVKTLNPLSEYGLELNRGVAEHVLGTPQSTHRVVVDVQTEAVEAQPDAHPVEVADQSVTGLEHPVQHIVHVLGGVVIANHRDGCVR